MEVDGLWHFVPDPIKLITKLGRSDLVNETHLFEYFVSVSDTVSAYSSPKVCRELAKAVCERYNISKDFSYVFHSLYSLHDFETFKKFFFIPNNAKLNDSATLFTNER